MNAFHQKSAVKFVKRKGLYPHFMKDIIPIYNTCFKECDRQSPKILRNRLRHKTYSVVKMLNENVAVVGFSFLIPIHKKKILHIDYVGIDPNTQGKGYGRMLMEYITKTYKKRGWIITLECEDHLIKFYEKLGFIRMNILYHFRGKTMNLMVCPNTKDNRLTFIRDIISNLNNEATCDMKSPFYRLLPYRKYNENIVLYKCREKKMNSSIFDTYTEKNNDGEKPPS